MGQVLSLPRVELQQNHLKGPQSTAGVIELISNLCGDSWAAASAGQEKLVAGCSDGDGSSASGLYTLGKLLKNRVCLILRMGQRKPDRHQFVAKHCQRFGAGT